VKLHVSDICIGEFHITQAILKPDGMLLPGEEYSFHVTGLPDGAEINKTNGAAPVYAVTKARDSERPGFRKSPVLLDKILKYYGCGPEVYVRFSNPVNDSNGVLVRTRVRNLNTNKVTEYYIAPVGNELYVGHDMCSGAFAFENGAIYEVEFAFMDASGNLSEWTEKIRFSKPVKQTSHDTE